MFTFIDRSGEKLTVPYTMCLKAAAFKSAQFFWYRSDGSGSENYFHILSTFG